jgi:hypothetical protein
MNEFIHGLAAIALGIFNLSADLAKRLADPSHVYRRKMPLRIAWHAAGIEIRRTMAGRTAHPDRAEIIGTAHNERLMRMAIIALGWPIAGGMTVHASRALDDLSGLVEQRDRPGILILNVSEG